MALTIGLLRRFSVDEYLRMEQAGILPPGERTELLDGRIVLKMAQDAPHVGGIALGTDAFYRALGDTHYVVSQVTVRLSNWSAPEPDFVLIARDQWRPGLQLTMADLFVEVSDSSLAIDRDTKAVLYALAGVAEYWIVNLIERQLEIYRDPETTPGGARYRTTMTCHEGGHVSPRCRPDVSIAVADLLPAPPPSPEQP